MENLLQVTNTIGVLFHVRIVRTGDRYGRNDCLTNEDQPMIEFYDASQDPEKFGPRGQFVSRYELDTVAKVVHNGTGINLCGHVRQWFVDADCVRAAYAFACDSL